MNLVNRLKGIRHDVWREIEEAQLFLVASSLAYTTILSIIPVLAVSFAVFEAFGGLEKLYGTIEPFILENLAEGSSDEVMSVLKKFISNAHTATIGASGFVALLFTSMSMLSSVEKAINRIWNVRVTRPLFQRFATYWLIVSLGPLALAVAVGFATSSSIPLQKLLPGTGIFVLFIGIFFAVYKYVPQRIVNWKPALLSATLTTVLWFLAQQGYSLYTRKVVTYNKIYGSLGAVPILLLWIYIAWLIILGGAALTAVLQRRRELP
jgi:membrane protein